ncbi:hypothetical protein P9112_007079 [Eukaryota sp. TZLM1-RC]
MASLQELFGISDLSDFSETETTPTEAQGTPMEPEDITIKLPSEIPSFPNNTRHYLIPPGFLHYNDSSDSPYTISVRESNGQIQSNTNVVHWSNGDVTFHIGSKVIIASPTALTDVYPKHVLASKVEGEEKETLVPIAEVERKFVMSKAELVSRNQTPRSKSITLSERPQLQSSTVSDTVTGANDVRLTEDFLES